MVSNNCRVNKKNVLKDSRVTFLNQAVESVYVAGPITRRRKATVVNLLAQFTKNFPQITYDLVWESPTINAQAWHLGSELRVRIYGGLARHPALTRSGLALCIAHETGHHLGGPPRDPAMRQMSWQGQADYWAARIAMPLIFGTTARNATMRGAKQILRLHEVLSSSMGEDAPDLSPQCRYLIFRAGASGLEIPGCAKVEFERELTMWPRG